MRRLLYEILTQVIIVIAKLRQMLTDNSWREKRFDRVFYCSNDERWSCCDCGLEHITLPIKGEEVRKNHFRFIPVRIRGYKYILRKFSEKPAPSVNEIGEGASPQ